VAEHNGELWVVGGVASSSKRTSVRVFNPQTEQWRDGPELPTAVSHAPLVSTGHKLYLLGGLTTGEVPSATVFSLDSEDPGGTWTEDVELPAPRFAGAAAWDGHRLVFAGGAEHFTPARERLASAAIWVLQNDTWEPVEELQEAREKLVAVTNKDDGTIWFGGGANVGIGQMVDNNVDVLRGETVSDDLAITPVQGAAAIWTPETGICVFGGSTTLPNADRSPVDLVDCLVGSEPDPEWPDLPQARYGAGAAVVGDTVYLVGDTADPVLALAGAVVPAG
jgi:N-acetylneuraminic acid mutarotase